MWTIYTICHVTGLKALHTLCHLILKLSEVGFVVILILHVKKQIRPSPGRGLLESRQIPAQAAECESTTTAPNGLQETLQSLSPAGPPAILSSFLLPPPNSSGLPLLLPSSYLLPESFLLCFLFHTLLLRHQLLSRLLASWRILLHKPSFLDHVSIKENPLCLGMGRGREAGIVGNSETGQGAWLG